MPLPHALRRGDPRVRLGGGRRRPLARDEQGHVRRPRRGGADERVRRRASFLGRGRGPQSCRHAPLGRDPRSHAGSARGGHRPRLSGACPVPGGSRGAADSARTQPLRRLRA